MEQRSFNYGCLMTKLTTFYTLAGSCSLNRRVKKCRAGRNQSSFKVELILSSVLDFALDQLEDVVEKQ